MRCTAPVRGHYTASGRENCPVCRYGGGYSVPRSYSVPPRRSSSSYPSATVGSSNRGVSSLTLGRVARPRWSPSGSSVGYTATEVRSLDPIRRAVEQRAARVDLRDVFLCHAWDDRAGPAKALHDQLESADVKVWFSEKDIPLGAPLLREIDRGLARSRIGIVLVTPALLDRLEGEGIADKELSELLARDLLIPVVHGTTYDALREVSPMLASRSGLTTEDQPLADVAAKIAELVHV